MSTIPKRRPRLPRFLAETLGLAILYLLTSGLGLLFAIPPVQVTLLWLPAGLAVAGALVLGRRASLGIWLGAFGPLFWQLSANGVTGPVTILLSALLAAGSTLQALAAAYLMRRWFPSSPASLTLTSIIKLFGLMALACLVAPTIGVTIPLLIGFITPDNYPLTWAIWWMGDWFGIVVGMPLFAVLGARLLGRPNAGTARLLIVSLGIGASLGLFVASWKLETQAVAARFAADAQVSKIALQRTMDTTLHNLDTLESLFVTSTDVSREKFQAFTRKYLSRDPAVQGLQALAWDAYVPAQARAAYEAAARREGFADYQFTERNAAGALVRAADRPDYVIVNFIEPLEANRAALGYDVSSDPIRQKAIVQARDTGHETMTAPITLVQETGTQKGFLVFRPIYRQGVALASVEARRANLLGFAVAVLRIGDIVEASLAPLPNLGRDIYFFDLASPPGEQLLYHHLPGAQPESAQVDPTIDLATLQTGIYDRTEIAIGGRRWLMVTRPASGSIVADRSWDPWGVLLAGLCFTALMVAYQFSRQRAELSLRESEQTTHLILETALDAVITIDANGHITHWNTQAETIFGWPKAEAIGQLMSEMIIPPELRTAHNQGLKHYLATNEGPILNQRIEITAQRRNGEYFPIELTIQPVKARGTTTFTAFAADISERKRAETVLQEAEIRYRTMIENAHDLIQSVAPDGRIEFANPAWQATLGYSADDLQSLTLWDVLHPTVLAQYEVEFARVMSGETVSAIETIFVAKDGREIYVMGTAVPRVVEGKVIATQTFFRDISAHKHEETLRAGRFAVTQLLAKSPSLAEATPELLHAMSRHLDWSLGELWLKDAAGILSWASGWHAGAAELAEFEAASQAREFAPCDGLPGRVFASGKPVWMQNVHDEPSFARAALAECAGLRAAVAFPIRDQTAVNGAIVLFSRAERPRDADMVELLLDLGQQIGQFVARKQAEAALETERASLERRVAERTADLSRANQELAQSARLKDEFLSNMSHELRTPLNAILGFSESLLEQLRGPLNQHQQIALQHIETSGRHLLALINDVLDLSKMGAGQMNLHIEETAIEELCQASLVFVKQLAHKKQIELAFECDDPQVKVQADPKRLKQMLVNLLSNAVKFTEPGGRVSLHVSTKAGAVQFAVQDTGIGIAPEGLARLFQPFTQLDSSLSRQHEGTGLGLALVHRLAELHGGSIAVESTVGKGSRFTIAMPYLAPGSPQAADLAPTNGRAPDLVATAPVAQTMPPLPAPAAARPRILLAEDNEVNILAFSYYLREKGYELVIAHNGREALDLADDAPPDLILMDIQMPAMDGLEVTRRLRANPNFACTPIVALTALAMPGDLERCLAAGATEYLTKPIGLKALLATIKRLLQT